jgi:hypothetical protein
MDMMSMASCHAVVLKISQLRMYQLQLPNQARIG